MSQVTLFISTVSHEFASYREALRHALTRHNSEVKIQEGFQPNGDVTIDKLVTYVQSCDAVVHLAGDQPGYPLNAPSLAWLQAHYPRLATDFPDLAEVLNGTVPASYTQWEAYLALLHKKTLLIAQPSATAPRDHAQPSHAGPVQPQAQHLDRLRRLGRYPEITFDNPDQLVAKLSVSVLLDLLLKATNPVQPRDLPYRSLGPLFKGREADLHALRAHLTDPAAPAALALTGLGGVGKTRLAVEYAWQHRPDYTALLLVSADSPATLDANLAALAGPRVLNLPEQAAPEQETRLRAVLDWLARHPGWLLVLDNVDTPEAAAAVEDWLPRLDGGRLLLTTRFSEFSPQVATLELGVLSEAAAAEFLLARTDHRRLHVPTDLEDALSLARLLGGLALALEQAGAYVYTQRISLADYQHLWQANDENVRAEFDEHLMHYASSVAATWQTSFNQLGPDARTLLARLAWLAPDPIPRTFLAVPVPGAADFNTRKALVELARYSLVRFAEGGRAFTVHPLVQEVSQTQQGQDAPLIFQQALEWVSEAFNGNPQNVRDWSSLDLLLPHVISVAWKHSPDFGNPGSTGFILTQSGVLLMAKAQFYEAEPLLRQALAIDLKMFGWDDYNSSTSINNLAVLLHELNKVEESESLHRRALSINEKYFGANSSETLAAINNLAELLRVTSREEEAEILYRRAIEITKKDSKINALHVANVFNNFAELLYGRKEFEEAEVFYRKALVIRQSTLGIDHPEVAVVTNNLAMILRYTKRVGEAEAMLRQSLIILERELGLNHLSVALCLNSLAGVLSDVGNFEEAKLFYQRALSIRESCFGLLHPSIATGLNNLAVLLHKMKQLPEAEKMYRRALNIIESELGLNHPRVISILSSLAALLLSMEQPVEAKECYERAQAIRQACQ